jgi:hypothetical protein
MAGMSLSRLSRRCAEKEPMVAHASLLEMQEGHPWQRLAAFQEDLESYINRYATLWAGTHCSPPTPDVSFSPKEQRRNEREVDKLIDFIERELPTCPENVWQRETWRARLLREARKVAAERLGYPGSHLDIIFSPAYFRVTRAFVHKARSFDNGISTEAMSQALRNVWVMNWIQMFFAQVPELTPSVFAYSMLYPYTDNFLDQSGITSEEKAALNHNLSLRLAGMEIQARGPYDDILFRLIGMIESEYPRGEFPEVYAALLAIHAGQVKSLMQQGETPRLNPGQTLRVSMEKGGASVLADGYLVTGRLAKEDAAFCFGLGVLLQLFDDLQDLQSDFAAMRWTVFSCTALGSSLDATTSRLYRYLGRVLAPTATYASPRCGVLVNLLRRNCLYLMLRAIAQNRRFYTAEYLRHMEPFSPLRFDYLEEQGRTVESRYGKISGILLARRNITSVFDLMD